MTFASEVSRWLRFFEEPAAYLRAGTDLADGRRSGPSTILFLPGAPRPMDFDVCRRAVNFAHIVGVQFDGCRGEVLLQAVQFARAGDRHDPGLLREQPGQSDLCRAGLLAGGDARQQIEQRLVGLRGLLATSGLYCCEF